jgi:hypothetical protein
MRYALPLVLLSATGLASSQTLGIELHASGLNGTVATIQDPLDPNTQFVLQQSGTIRVVQNGTVLATPFMTVSVLSGSERGLLGMAFPPDHAQTGHFYLNYTTSGVFMQLSRFTRVGTSLTADPATRFDIFRTQRPFPNHNAGTIVFGPDGYLYLPTGDGGSSGDPGNRAQNPNELLGKMVRIDPSRDDFPGDATKNYGIPASNPFLPANNPPISALPEIWSFGLRNPWKVSFDRPEWLGTGALLIADVGQGTREEVSYEPMGRGGRNYGWRRFEGTFVHSASTALAYSPHQPPVHEYPRTDGQSITGGHVYRGLQLGPEYFGRYFFADYVAARLWSIGLDVDPVTGEATPGTVVEHSDDLGGAGAFGNPASIDVDAQGEIFITSLGGQVYRLYRPETTWLTSASAVFGPYLGGQVRSLVLPDGKTFDVQPIRPNLASPRRGGVRFTGKTNKTVRQFLDVSATGRVSASVAASAVLEVKDQQTGLFEQVASGVWNATGGTLAATGLDAARFVGADGGIEARAVVTYGGIIPGLTFRLLVDHATLTVR